MPPPVFSDKLYHKLTSLKIQFYAKSQPPKSLPKVTTMKNVLFGFNFFLSLVFEKKNHKKCQKYFILMRIGWLIVKIDFIISHFLKKSEKLKKNIKKIQKI